MLERILQKNSLILALCCYLRYFLVRIIKKILRGFMQKTIYVFLLILPILGGCTEESRNKIFKQADNVLGKDLRITYVADSGKIVKSWTVKDGKVTTHKDDKGSTSGYYYFWSVESGYVQSPIVRSIVEEIKN
tara:strand:+ start:85 stop:483 length:399 start_codon:yes stop_codon:yes gene_type:complete